MILWMGKLFARGVSVMEKISVFLDNFMSATAWTMAQPTAYGPFHLGFAFIGFALSIFLAWKFRNLGDKGHKILMLSCGIFLALTEVYKQLFYFYYIGEGSYQWWIFPFQMCSVPMYLCIIAPLLKKGAIQQGMYNFMMIFNLLGGFMAFVEPSGITHEYWTLTLHAFIWHMILVFIGLYLAISNRGGKTIKDYKYAAVTFIALCLIAFIINLILWDVSEGTVNMFFIGPANSSLIVFKQIAEMCGWYISTLLYIPVVCLGGYLIFLPFHLHARKKNALTV